MKGGGKWVYGVVFCWVRCDSCSKISVVSMFVIIVSYRIDMVEMFKGVVCSDWLMCSCIYQVLGMVVFQVWVRVDIVLCGKFSFMKLKVGVVISVIMLVVWFMLWVSMKVSVLIICEVSMNSIVFRVISYSDLCNGIVS